MRKLKVLEMIDRPFLGGGQVTLVRLARHLDRDRFEVSACSAGGGPLVEELARERIPHFPASFNKRFNPAIVGEIENILKSNRIDILHTHGGIAGLYGRWAGRRAGTPVLVHTLHGIHYLHYRNLILKTLSIKLEKAFSRFTDAVILVSDADFRRAGKFRLAPAAKLALIKNGLDFPGPPEVPNVMEERRKIGLEPSDAVIGTVARLHRQKGLVYLIRAAGRIFNGAPAARIVVVGGGPLEKALQKEIARRGLEGRFHLLGERADSARILSLLDIFVLPSLWEGLPYVLLEAASLGKPIVATAIDGVTEVLQDGQTGLLVPPADSGSLASAVLRLLKDHQLAAELGRSALAQIPPQFKLSLMIGQTERLYLSLWEKRALSRPN